MTREMREKKEIELQSKTGWTKLIHLKAKCSNTKTVNYTKKLNGNHTRDITAHKSTDIEHFATLLIFIGCIS